MILILEGKRVETVLCRATDLRLNCPLAHVCVYEYFSQTMFSYQWYSVKKHETISDEHNCTYAKLIHNEEILSRVVTYIAQLIET